VDPEPARRSPHRRCDPRPRPGYVAAIERNVLAELRTNKSFEVADCLDRVLSDEIRWTGRASEVLRAVQGLHRAGLIVGIPPNPERSRTTSSTRRLGDHRLA
jgi:hypothetical protein